MTAWETSAITDPGKITCYWTHPTRRSHGLAIACRATRLVWSTRTSPNPGKPASAEWDRPALIEGCDVFADLCAVAGQPFPADIYTV